MDVRCSLHDSRVLDCVAAQCSCCLNVRHFSQYYDSRSERLAHDQMAARALATLVVNKEAGYRRLWRYALIIKQDHYNSTAPNMGYAYTWQIARTAGHCEELARIGRP